MEGIEGYEIIGELDRGGMATVYRARQLSLRREVALKILPENMEGDARAVAQFRREAEVAAALKHDGIVKIIEAHLDAPPYYLTMELLDGRALLDRLQEGPLAPEAVLPVLAQLGSALDYAHARGHVHLDLKPANILFNEQNRPVLIDFGIVRTANLTRTVGGVAYGTPAYMSPEQANMTVVDHRSDLYSLGAVLFEMLAGRPPFFAPTNTHPTAVIHHIINSPAPPLSDFRPELARLNGFFVRALAKDPGQRFQSGGELAAAFAAALQAPAGTGPTAVPVSPPTVAVRPPAAPVGDAAAPPPPPLSVPPRPPAVAPVPPGTAHVRRPGPIRLIAACLLVVVLGAGGYLALGALRALPPPAAAGPAASVPAGPPASPKGDAPSAPPACKHGVSPKSKCRLCNPPPPAKCRHGNIRDHCSICNGPKLCRHGNRPSTCPRCHPQPALCRHGNTARTCRLCHPPEPLCPHGKKRAACPKCAG